MAKKKRTRINIQPKTVSNAALVVAYRIREARSQKYKTSKEAAIAFGTEPSHWSKWETALTLPAQETLDNMVVFFELSDAEYFTQEPENWRSIRKEFLAKLQRRSTAKKAYYTFSDVNAGDQKESQSNGEGTDIFLELYELISNARKQVKEGVMNEETYDRHMKNFIDVITVGMYGKK